MRLQGPRRPLPEIAGNELRDDPGLTAGASYNRARIIAVPDNRRTSTRYFVELPCALTIVGEAGPPAALFIVNLSIGGALVRRPRLPLGVRTELRFAVPGYDDISPGAVVRWSTDDEVGLQFDGLRPRDVWALSKYFESLP